MPRQPNILFLVLDTQRRDHLSLYGYDVETSPELDAFAQEATVFERAVAPAQWTIPAHGSLFTGLYPSTHQLTQASGSLPPAYPTLAELLQPTHHTVAFCNNPLLGVLNNGLQRGFDAFYNYAGVAPERPVDMRRTRIRRMAAQSFRQMARRVYNEFTQSDWMFRLALNPLLVPLWTRLANFKGSTERSISDLIAYWGQHRAGGSDEPLFAFVNLMGVHLPYHPSQEIMQRVAPDVAHDKHAYRYMAQFNADGRAWISPAHPPLADWQARTLNAFYDAEITYQDQHVGRLFRALRQMDELDNTLVIIAADHGEGHGDHGYLGHSFVVYQELVHVPLIIRHPARYPARRIATNISTRRIFHTILDYAGLTPPIEDGAALVDRLSLARSLNGRPDPEGGTVYAEAVPPTNLLNIMQGHQPELVRQLRLHATRRGVYSGDHKLALVGDEVEQLFNVATDPNEEHDVADEQPDVAAALSATVNAFVRQAEQQRTAAAVSHAVSADMLDHLRALGYVE